MARFLSLVICVAFLLCFGNGQTAQAEKNVEVHDWLIVPVFYATNRSFNGTNEVIEYSEMPNKGGMLFGVKNIAAPMPANCPADHETQNRMCWQIVHIKEKPTPAGQPEKQSLPPAFNGKLCMVKDQTMNLQEVMQSITNYMDSTKTHEAIIFVHGCCANFDTTIQRAAKVAASMQVPVLVYDWVSPRGFTKYLENETLLEQTTDDFCKFLDVVEQKENLDHVSLLGHSMGNRFVDEAMVRRAEHYRCNPLTPRFKELILSNADMDAIAFLKHADKFAANAKETRIYISRKDDRLEASTIAHGGFSRLGAPGDFALLPHIENLDFIDITDYGSVHELPFCVIANLHRNGNLSHLKGFQLKQVYPGVLSVARSSL